MTTLSEFMEHCDQPVKYAVVGWSTVWKDMVVCVFSTWLVYTQRLRYLMNSKWKLKDADLQMAQPTLVASTLTRQQMHGRWRQDL